MNAFLLGCLHPNKKVTVHLSLQDTTIGTMHYVKFALINHSSEDLYVTTFNPAIIIYENGKDITEDYYIHETPVLSNPPFKDPMEHAFKNDLLPSGLTVRQLRIKFEAAAVETERAKMFELNPADSTENHDRWRDIEFMFHILMIKKYQGIPIKAGDTTYLYSSISGLFDDFGQPKGTYEIKLDQSNEVQWIYKREVVKIDDIRYYTPRMDLTVDGYKLYAEKVYVENSLKVGNVSD